MRVAHVVLHSCVRAYKQGWILKERGHQVHIVTERPVHAYGWKDFDALHLVHTGHLDGAPRLDKDQIYSTIKAINDSVDIFHFHNEPDWPMEVIRAATKKPLVYDIHDMVSQRQEMPDEEKTAFECADAFVCPSRDYVDIVKGRSNKPVIELLSCVPSKLFPTVRRKPFHNGLVYEGGLKGKPREGSQQFEFRSWKDVFTMLGQLDVPITAYPTSGEEDYSEYAKGGAMIMQPVNYDEMLKNLTSFEAGLVGTPFNTGAFNGANPNKMFEYAAAGIPMIALKAPTAKGFLEATGFGIGVENVEDIPAAMNELWESGARDEVWELRKHWTMETQVDKLETLYSELLGEKSNVIKPDRWIAQQSENFG